MADDGSGRIKQGNPAIALDAPLLEAGVRREELADPFGMMRGPCRSETASHGVPVEGSLEVFNEFSASPHRMRSKPQAISQQLGDEGVLAAECRCQVLNERVEETIASFRFNSLDDLAQRRVAGRAFCREPLFPIKKNSSPIVREFSAGPILVPIRQYANRQ